MSRSGGYDECMPDYFSVWAVRTPLCARRGAVLFAKPEHFAERC